MGKTCSAAWVLRGHPARSTPSRLVPLLTLHEAFWVLGGRDDVQDGAAIPVLLVDAAFPLRFVVHQPSEKMVFP